MATIPKIGAAVVAAFLTVAAPSQAAVSFNFNFLDPAGVGFNAAGQTGLDRRAGLSLAGSYISSVLGPAYTATIHIDVSGDQTNDNTLASAGSNFNENFPGNGFGSMGDVQRKILGGNAADPAPGVADGLVDWNFQDFAWEPLNDFQPGEMDLIATAIHELTHTIGFSSDVDQAGFNGYGDAPGSASAWSPFDEFLADADGNAIINSSGVLNASRWNAASDGGTGAAGLQFTGANAVAANGGNPVYLYSPTAWEDGSSGSHLDTDFYNNTNGNAENMMNHAPSIDSGMEVRQYSDLELGILRDLGYTQLVGNPNPALPGDYNADGFVSQSDLDLVLLNWGDNTAPAGFDPANLQGGGPFDGLVSQNELDGVLINWGNGTPASSPPTSGNTAVPEPACLTLLSLGCAALIRRRR